MTSLSRTCFSQLGRICLVLLAARAIEAGRVTGQIELADSREASVRKLKDYSGVVIWLARTGPPTAPDASGQPTPAAPRADSVVRARFLEEAAGSPQPPVSAERHTITQKGKRFSPHVLAVPVGSVVHFPNLDPIFHNAFSNFAGQPFDTGLYAPGTSREVVFRRAGIVRVFCNIHSNMSAVIAVMNTPFFTMTGPAGTFRIENVPEGVYQLRVWHERAAEATLRSLERRLSLGAEPVSLPAIRISESGYLVIPHRNKHGLEYPPAGPEHGVYPGGRR